PHEKGLEQAADAYCLSLPHGVSASYAERLLSAHPKAVVIDLSGDLRLPTAEAYRAWYGHEHPAPALLGQAPYRIPQLGRQRLPPRPPRPRPPRPPPPRLISNPGCYATSVLLPLVPLVREGLVDEGDVVVDAKSGATGAGRSPREDLLFSEVADDFSAYSPGR